MNFGTALAGYGQAQPEIQKLLEKQQSEKAQAGAMQALRQMMMQQGGGQPATPQGMPQQQPLPGAPAGGLNSPQGGPVPLNRPAASPAPGGGPMPPAPAPPMGGLPNQGAATPRNDMMQMIDIVSNLPGMNDTQKYQALVQMGAFTAPMEKYTQQMDLASQKLSMQQEMLSERLKTMQILQGMKDSTSSSNTDKRVAATERGQDIVSSDKAATRTQNYEKMSGVDLRGELTSITQRLTNDPKLSSADRKALNEQWQAAKTALDQKRAAKGLPPDKTKVPAGSGESAIDPSKLSDTEERSFDGGKTWWHLQDGKPVQSGG